MKSFYVHNCTSLRRNIFLRQIVSKSVFIWCSFTHFDLNNTRKASKFCTPAPRRKFLGMDHLAEVVHFLKACVERLESEFIDARVTANRKSSKVRALISAVNRVAETAKYIAKDVMSLFMEVEIKMKIENVEIASVFWDSAKNTSESSSLLTHTSEEMDRWYEKMDAEEAAESGAKKKEEDVIVID